MPVGPCEAPAASNACDDVWSSVYVWASINTWELPPTILRWTFTAACPHAGTAWLVWCVVITSWQSINHTPERMKRCICNQSPVGRLACSHQDHNLREVWSCCMMRWGVTAASQRLDSLYECIYGSAQTSQSINIAMLAQKGIQLCTLPAYCKRYLWLWQWLHAVLQIWHCLGDVLSLLHDQPVESFHSCCYKSHWFVGVRHCTSIT